MRSMEEVIYKIFNGNKGILAADESTPTMGKRLQSVGVASTILNRHTYRHTIFSSPNLESYIGGVILYDETMYNEPTIEPLREKDIVLGIKVDKGAKPYDNYGGKLTEGLDGLSERLVKYKKKGAEFSKWRAVISVTDKDTCILANAWTLARYAKKCQDEGIVPIVEPEVLMDGEHDIIKCQEVTAKVLKECYKELRLHNVNLKGTILKPNMILPGNKSKDKSNTAEIAKMTLRCLKENVPSEVPGIAFLSGGQTEIEATQNLNEINKINDTKFIMSFSYGRALQQSALKNWAKNIKDTTNTQKIFNHRSKMNGLSTSAKWNMNLENQITI